MNQAVRLIHEPPSIENTIPYTLYQASSPQLNFIEEDKLVIYGGGNDFSITCDINIPDLNLSSVSLFVLNCSVIFWFNDNHIGIEITYPTIIFHGLNRDFIYLNIEDNEILGNYITIRSNAWISNNINPLFNNLSSKLHDIYNALSLVSNTYANDNDGDEEDDGDDKCYGDQYNELPRLDMTQAMNDDSDTMTPEAIYNSGQADDLDDNDMEYDVDDENNNEVGKYGAGMNVDVGYASIAGMKTRRESDGYHDEQDICSYKTKRNKLG